jgi:flagellar motor component MotA
VSIVTLIAALGLVVIATAASLGGVLMVLVGVLIIVGGGWHAVSRRGPVRTISVLVGALRIRIPRHALGASPAAKATSPLAFEDLVQVALGRSSG